MIIIHRIRAVNRYITQNLRDNSATIMETFDLSECYSKLDQEEISRILARMISIAFQKKRCIAVNPKDN